MVEAAPEAEEKVKAKPTPRKRAVKQKLVIAGDENCPASSLGEGGIKPSVLQTKSISASDSRRDSQTDESGSKGDQVEPIEKAVVVDVATAAAAAAATATTTATATPSTISSRMRARPTPKKEGKKERSEKKTR